MAIRLRIRVAKLDTCHASDQSSPCAYPITNPALHLLFRKAMALKTQPHPVGAAPDLIEFKSLLLVDDDCQLAEALQWILADAYFLVDVAHDGEEALLKVKANCYDAVICDVLMPKLRGDEFYQRAVEIRPHLSDRFIFITACAADPKTNLFLCKTDAKYLIKPFPVQTLIDCVKQLLV
jgi:response regulator RpfG family c-di-GMP phosphodiesterase